MGRENPGVEVAFGRGEADRRVAGVAAAARIVRDLAERGTSRVVLAVPEAALAEATLEDILRLSPGVAVEIVDRPGGAAIDAPRLDPRKILGATAKASDGLVSRHLNRPLSRAMSRLLLRVPGIRPMHATVGTTVLAIAMFAALIAGGGPGLVAGGLLFHVASVFDGVDGEIARATCRTSRLGALLDSIIDMATNILFFIGVTINLSVHSSLALSLGAFGLLLMLLGLVAISRAASRDDRPFSMDVVKRRYGARFSRASSGRLIRLLTIVTSRDFFALLFALLILVGLPMVVLYLFAAAAAVWILFVIGAFVVPTLATTAEGSA